MPSPMAAHEVLEREFLEIRARILQVAAALDRIDRSEGAVDPADPRVTRIQQGIAALASRQPDRAEQVQLLFSLPYDADWRKTYSLAPRG